MINNVDEQLTDETIELEMDISRVYFDIGSARRSEAFNNGRSKEQRLPGAFENRLNSSNQPQPVVVDLAPKPESKPNYGPLFTLERASTLLKVALRNVGSGKAVTFGPLKKAVEQLHLGDQHEWRPEELKAQSNNLKAWENRLQNELVKLRRADVVHYRQTKGDYYIF